jgi:uncharacterized protein YdeI (YjbR/CyaY-like superfamily)
LEVTERQCRDVGIETGDVVRVELRRASTEPPTEILELIRSEPTLAERWVALTPARKRQVAEHVRAAKRAERRVRRARKALS